jgi:hypothetical protein
MKRTGGWWKTPQILTLSRLIISFTLLPLCPGEEEIRSLKVRAGLALTTIVVTVVEATNFTAAIGNRIAAVRM